MLYDCWYSYMRGRELSVNIGQLEHVVEAIRFSSFALAAKARHTSPQALSKAVSDLERELGVKLFERTGRSVEATPFAREFEKKARHVLLEFEQLRRFPATFFAESSENCSFRLAISDSSFRGLILTEQDFAPLRDESGLNVNLYRASSDSCLSAIRQDIADAAILPGPVDEVGLLCFPVHKSLASVIVDKGWPLGMGGAVSLAEIVDRPIACPRDIRFVRPYIESQFRARGLVPRFQFVEPTLNGFLSFLGNGGVVFIRKGGSIPKDVAGIFEVDLQDRDSFAIPFFLVCKVGCPPETVELMIAFFREKLG